MKSRFALLLALTVVVVMTAAGQNAKPFVIPELKEWKGGTGKYIVSPLVRLVNQTGGDGGVVQQLADDWRFLFGQPLAIAKQGEQPRSGDIVMRLAPTKGANPESYTIKIGSMVEVSAPTRRGLYWATRTLLQMGEATDGLSLPKGTINDSPDFEVRGMMIDCARKFIPMEYLQSLIRIMAYYKMNTLQVHLNDNGFPKYFDNDWQKTYSAFRLECDTYPGLTARDGYYTKWQFTSLQMMAADCGVEIIPEIDAPAHCLAFTKYKPELGSERFGMDHLDITNPQTVPFLDSLWKEYLKGDEPVFIGPRVHIGTDEYNNSDPAVVEKFRALADHLIKYVEGYGKQACMWGSLTHAKGQTPVKSKGVTMSLWYNGYAEPDSMLRLGYRGISIPDGLVYIVPHAGYYYDYLNTEHLYNNWTPNQVGDKTFKYDDPRIEGGMFAVWNDICGNGISVKDIHHRVYPALQTLSQKLWTGRSTTLPYAVFDSLRHRLSESPWDNELGTLHRNVYRLDTVRPNQTEIPGFDIVEAGYPYRVSFHLKAAEEQRGAVLFFSPNSTFYLADPVSGRLGYDRDGYLYTFDFAPYFGEEIDIAIEGDHHETRLYVNGTLAERKNGRTFWTDGKTKVTTVETLVFPLQFTGNFHSTVTNLEVRKKP